MRIPSAKAQLLPNTTLAEAASSLTLPASGDVYCYICNRGCSTLDGHSPVGLSEIPAVVCPFCNLLFVPSLLFCPPVLCFDVLPCPLLPFCPLLSSPLLFTPPSRSRRFLHLALSALRTCPAHTALTLLRFAICNITPPQNCNITLLENCNLPIRRLPT